MAPVPCDVAQESEVSATVPHTSGICPLPTPAPHTASAPAQAPRRCHFLLQSHLFSLSLFGGPAETWNWMSKCQAWLKNTHTHTRGLCCPDLNLNLRSIPQPQALFLTCLSLSFLTHKMGMIVTACEVVVRMKERSVSKVPGHPSCPGHHPSSPRPCPRGLLRPQRHHPDSQVAQPASSAPLSQSFSPSQRQEAGTHLWLVGPQLSFSAGHTCLAVGTHTCAWVGQGGHGAPCQPVPLLGPCHLARGPGNPAQPVCFVCLVSSSETPLSVLKAF